MLERRKKRISEKENRLKNNSNQNIKIELSNENSNRMIKSKSFLHRDSSVESLKSNKSISQTNNNSNNSSFRKLNKSD